jgi:hypothetical protein
MCPVHDPREETKNGTNHSSQFYETEQPSCVKSEVVGCQDSTRTKGTRRPCKMLQPFVLSRPRTCPRGPAGLSLSHTHKHTHTHTHTGSSEEEKNTQRQPFSAENGRKVYGADRKLSQRQGFDTAKGYRTPERFCMQANSFVSEM